VNWEDVDGILSQEKRMNAFERYSQKRDESAKVTRFIREKKNENSDSNGSELEKIDQMLKTQRQQNEFERFKQKIIEEQDPFSQRLLEICQGQGPKMSSQNPQNTIQKMSSHTPQAIIRKSSFETPQTTAQKEKNPKGDLLMNSIKNNLEAFNFVKTQNKTKTANKNNNNGRGYVRVAQTQEEVIAKSPPEEEVGKGGFMSQISADYQNFKKNLMNGGSQAPSTFKTRTFSNDYSLPSKVSSGENSRVMEEEFIVGPSQPVVKSFAEVIKKKKTQEMEEEEEQQKPSLSYLKTANKKIPPFLSRNNGIPDEVKGMRTYMRTISDEYDDPLGFNDFTEITNKPKTPVARSDSNEDKKEELLTKRKLPVVDEKDDEEDTFFNLLKKMK